ncbi:MAG: hypothetical protein R8M45_03760 [Ghiorsea sp.]
MSKSLHDFLVEGLSVKQAENILGINGSYSSSDVKKAFRNTAKSSHPDHGGNTESMVNVNLAYEKLGNGSAFAATTSDFKTNKSTHNSYEEQAAKYRDLRDSVNNQLRNTFDPSAYANYFESVFGMKFEVDPVEYKGMNSNDPSYAGLDATFKSVTGNISFVVDFALYLTNIGNSDKGLGDSSDTTMTFDISGTGFLSNRKYKMYNSYWKTDKILTSHINDAKLYFPKAKLLKHAKTAMGKKATKKDFITSFIQTLGMKRWNNDSYIVDFDGKTAMKITRTVFMRKGVYGVDFGSHESKYKFVKFENGPSAKYKFSANYDYLPESNDLLNIFVSLKGKTLAQRKKILEDFKKKSDRENGI